MEINEHVRFSMLFDIYGKLLSKKQFEVMDKFLNLDLSESELAGFAGESRQSVHDAVVKAKKQLIGFEEKCHLLENKLNRDAKLNQIKAFLQKDTIDKNKIAKIVDELVEY